MKNRPEGVLSDKFPENSSENLDPEEATRKKERKNVKSDLNLCSRVIV